MPFTYRQRIPILPFLRLNLSKSGHSWTWHLGPWSYNTRSRRQSLDLPGPVNYQHTPPPQRESRRSRRRTG